MIKCKALPVLAVLASLVLLGACSAPSAPKVPASLSLTTLPGWWATTPGVALSDYSEMRVQFAMKNNTGGTVTFEGDGGGANPADELQLWSTPTVGTDFTLRMDDFPQGNYADGATMEWDLTIELGAAAGAAEGFAVRPDVSPVGTAGPEDFELVSSEITLSY